MRSDDRDSGALLSAGGGSSGRQVSAEAAFERLAIERRMLVGSRHGSSYLNKRRLCHLGAPKRSGRNPPGIVTKGACTDDDSNTARAP